MVELTCLVVEPPDDVAMTLAEFAAWADPPISLPTLKRITADVPWLAQQRTGGRPARAYRFEDLLAVHADWVRRRA